MKRTIPERGAARDDSDMDIDGGIDAEAMQRNLEPAVNLLQTF
jgi:hypothetical protein